MLKKTLITVVALVLVAGSLASFKRIDLMPTIAAAAQASSQQGVAIDGRDILPLATGEGAEAWSRETLFWQSGYYRVVRHGDWKLQVSDNPNKA